MEQIKKNIELLNNGISILEKQNKVFKKTLNNIIFNSKDNEKKKIMELKKNINIIFDKAKKGDNFTQDLEKLKEKYKI